MALRIRYNGSVEQLTPGNSSYYNVGMIEEVIGGFPNPRKVGLTWIILNSDENEVKIPEILNPIATAYFGYEIYGDVMVVTSKELPPDWDLLDYDDQKYTIEEIENQFLGNLHDMSLITFNQDMGNYKDMFNTDTGVERNPYVSLPKAEYIYNPDKAEDSEGIQKENFQDFLMDSYNFIINTAEEKKMIVFEDDYHLIKIENKDHKIKTIDQLINIFLGEEEYEKCVTLRDVKEKIK